MQDRILLVGRNNDLIDFLHRLFVMDGCEVATAGDQQDVQRVLETGQPQLILVEMTMLGQDGIELIRLACCLPNAPIIILAFSSDVSRVNAAFELGVDGYLAVPFKPHELRSGVRALLAWRRDAQLGRDVSRPMMGGIQSYTRWLQGLGPGRRFELTVKEGVLRFLAPIHSRRSIQ